MQLAELMGFPDYQVYIMLGLLVLVIVLVIVKKKQQQD
jgi:hypothetical protein